MLITADALLAMCCPECGEMDVHSFSCFAFSEGNTVKISCSCGATKLEVRKSKSVYLLQSVCPICESGHLHKVKGKKLWRGEHIQLVCYESGLLMGSIGSQAQVSRTVTDQGPNMQKLLNGAGDTYFNTPEIMFEVLECLRDIADDGKLYCQCGNCNIEVDMFPDRLELRCNSCDSINIVYAETEEDLQVIKKVDSIELARHGFECLDSLANADRLKETRFKRNET